MLLGDFKRYLIGTPIETARQVHERLTKRTALAVFSSDALSSVAYATQEILIHMAPAGVLVFSRALPISGLIVLLLIVVGISYRQTIMAYPSGGGSYIVAKDNLGTLPGLTAGAALLIDYVLTVAVSISAGVEAAYSALPALQPYRVPLCLAAIAMITLANLRGVRESGAIFSLPTYFFITTFAVMIGLGILQAVAGTLGTVVQQPGLDLFGPHGAVPAGEREPVTLFFLMAAFASGCTALTGVEAISNGVPAFRKPESSNARTTLTVMVAILGIMFVGITFLATAVGAKPLTSNGEILYETIPSQVARTVFGGTNLPYYLVQAATALILLLAANTAYADFPRLTSLIARDRFLPRQFASLGDRLVFSNGILILALLSAILIVIFQGSVTNLIPLYAVGVFLSFTLSQLGMVRRWIRLRGAGWLHSAAINSVGATATFVVLLIIGSTKFVEGAWLVIVLIPILVLMFVGIHKHYETASRQLSLEGLEPPPPLHNTVIVPVSTLHRGVINALKYAEAMAPGHVTAVHVAMDDEQTAKLRAKWGQWGGETPLVVLDSPYRSLVRPLLRYLDEVDRRWDNDVITVVLPEFVPARWWHNLLHNQTALLIKSALLFRRNRVVVSVPYQLER